MIDFLFAVLLAASLGVAITCTTIGAGMFCVMALRDFLRGGRKE